jgi:formate hydrogenlyase subunit 4
MNPIGDSSWLSVLVIIVGAIIVAILGTVFALLFRGVDRKLVAHMQGRIGPPIIQPFRDVRKLLIKENIVPDGAVSWLFNAAPIVCLVVTIVLLLYIPIFGQQALLDGYGDSILIVYLLIVPSLAFVAGGFASSSPYATVGAQREMVIMMSYEFSLALVVVAIAWRIVPVTTADPFMLSTVSVYPVWNLVGPLGIVGTLILLFALVTVTPGEVSKVPFDIAEAETEIAGGILVEYSGRNLALFYLSDALKAFVMVSLIVALFFPYNLSPVIGISAAIPAAVVNGLFFLVKVFVIMFVSVMLVRAAMARFKISQASYIYLIAMTLISLVGLILMGVDLML